MKPKKDQPSVAFLGSVAAAAIGFAVLAAVAAGFFLGHFTGHSTTTTVTTAATAPTTEPTAGGEPAVAGSGSEITPETLEAAASPSDAALTEGAGANWATVGGDLANTRYSSLDEIDTENVANMHLAWQAPYSQELSAKSGSLEEESAPLVNEGVMYVITPEDNVVAANAATGEKLWEFKANITKKEDRTEYNAGVQGLAIGEGLVFLETNAGYVIGLDGTTGKQVWKKLAALGETKLESPSTPDYYEGVVYVGVSGGEVGRGHVDAYDAKTGELKWRRFLVCGPTEEPTGSAQCPKGQRNPNEGGGSVWTYPAFDVDTGLLYVTTANPSAEEGDGSNYKWSDSLVALNMETGAIEWGFQAVHHDLWDYDETTPPVFFTTEINGEEREVVSFTGKPDLHFELDAKTGEPVLPIKEEPAPTSAAGITPDVAAQKAQFASEKQPIPANSEESEVVPHCASEKYLPNPAPDGSKYVYSCTFAAPGSKRYIAYGIGSSGGQDGKTPLAYDAETQSLYYCEMVSFEAQKMGSTTRGGSFLGVQEGWQGSVAEVNVTDNKMGWRAKMEAPEGSCRGGDTITAGGVLFTSANHGKFHAYNVKTGESLFEFQGPENVWAAPIAYEAEGHEYVAIYYGGQVALTGGMTTPHTPRMLVFSVEGTEQPSVGEMPKSEFSPTEEEARKLAAEGKEGNPAETGEAEGGEAEAEPEGEGEAEASSLTGEEIFSSNCGLCHTLAAAKATGTEGPNLDQLKPSEAVVEKQVINGGGAMPAFGKLEILSQAEVEAVSKYVASEAGK